MMFPVSICEFVSKWLLIFPSAQAPLISADKNFAESHHTELMTFLFLFKGKQLEEKMVQQLQEDVDMEDTS